MASYLKTYTGKRIDPLNVKSEDIDIRDIAHALSLICRGNGQVTHFYSVGQHCINAVKEAKARNYSDRALLACLLHDGAEAYIADLIRPVKVHMPEYEKIEKRFLDAIFEKFGLNDINKDEWALVRSVDDDILMYDLVELLKEPLPEGGYRCMRVPDLELRAFEEVENEFIMIYESLINKSI